MQALKLQQILEPGFPRKISVEMAHKWMGFEVVTKKKGTFVDGHEQDDVAEYGKVSQETGVLGVPQSQQCPHSYS